MSLVIDANPVPLKFDEDGTVRVAGTRLTLDTIVTAYQLGSTAEQVVEQFPGISLPDVYGVIGFYLRNRQEVDAYLNLRKKEAESIRQRIETLCAPAGFRDRLLARRAEK